MSSLPTTSRRVRRQRGAIAVMAVWILAVMCLLGIGAFGIGQHVTAKQDSNDYADALAMVYGEQMVMQPVQLHGPALVRQNVVAIGNNAPADLVSGLSLDLGSVLTKSDRYLPGSASLTVSGGVKPAVSSILDWSLHDMFYRTPSAALVRQLQVTRLNVQEPRLMLLLDYSASMRLSYNNSANPALAAVNILRTAVSAMLVKYERYVSFGLRIFDQTMSNADSIDPQPGEDPAKMVADIQARVTSRRTGGDGTDMADPLLDAINAIDKGTNSSILNGRPYFILVTDGEPDAGPGVEAPATRSRSRSPGLTRRAEHCLRCLEGRHQHHHCARSTAADGAADGRGLDVPARHRRAKQQDDAYYFADAAIRRSSRRSSTASTSRIAVSQTPSTTSGSRFGTSPPPTTPSRCSTCRISATGSRCRSSASPTPTR